MPNIKGGQITKPLVPWDSQRQERFLEVLRDCGIVRRALEAVGSQRSSYYEFLKRNPDFKEKARMARQDAIELLEEECLRRAKDGVKEPVFHKGEEVATVQKYSDSLAMFLLKGGMPDKYRERSEIAHTGLPERVAIYLPSNDRESDNNQKS